MKLQAAHTAQESRDAPQPACPTDLPPKQQLPRPDAQVRVRVFRVQSIWDGNHTTGDGRRCPSQGSYARTHVK